MLALAIAYISELYLSTVVVEAARDKLVLLATATNASVPPNNELRSHHQQLATLLLALEDPVLPTLGGGPVVFL
jgi:hypothetical protein